MEIQREGEDLLQSGNLPEPTTAQVLGMLVTLTKATFDAVQNLISLMRSDSEWLTSKEAALLVGETEGIVREKARQGIIESRQRDGRSKEYNRRSLLQYIARKNPTAMTI